MCRVSEPKLNIKHSARTRKMLPRSSLVAPIYNRWAVQVVTYCKISELGKNNKRLYSCFIFWLSKLA